MSSRDRWLALLTIVIWGVNFVVIKFGLEGIPPFLLGSLRFLCVAFPAIFLIPKPKIPLRLIVLYGLTISFAQFAFLFSAMKVGMPAGLASLVLQAQAFFTLLFGALFFQEVIQPRQLLGLVMATLGIVVLAMASLSNYHSGEVTLLGFALMIGAAISWAMGNTVNKYIGRVSRNSNFMALVVWSALVPILPFLGAAWWFEGQTAVIQSLSSINLKSLLSILYLSLASTLLGYSVWGSLLARYETARVAPMTLLVPIVGLIAAWLILGETLSVTQLVGIMLVMAGLVINVFGRQLLMLRST